MSVQRLREIPGFNIDRVAMAEWCWLTSAQDIGQLVRYFMHASRLRFEVGVFHAKLAHRKAVRQIPGSCRNRLPISWCSAPQVQKAARRRLEQAADALVQHLLG
jgi:hypothetical protein